MTFTISHRLVGLIAIGLASAGIMVCPAVRAEPPRTTQPAARVAEAKAWLALAYDDACKVDADNATENLDLLAFVGGAQANAGDTAGAIKTAGQLADRAARARSGNIAGFDRIAAVAILINVGQTGRAKSLLDAFENDIVQKLAAHKLAAGDFDLKWSIGEIAAQRARLGDLPAATALIAKVPNPGDRALCRCQLAEMLFAVGKRDAAFKSLQLAHDESADPESNVNIAVDHLTYEILVGAGEVDAACQYQSFEAGSNGIVFEIVEALSHLQEFGPHDTAQALTRSTCAKLEKLPDADFKDVYGYLKMAWEQAFTAEDFPGALRTIHRAEAKFPAMKPGDRREALIKAAAVYARAGDANSYRQALASADQIKELPTRYGGEDLGEDHIHLAYFNVAQALAATGKFDEALETAKQCPQTIIKAKIATEMARAGLLDRAIELASGERMLLENLRPLVWAAASSGRDLAPLKRASAEMSDPERRGTVELAAAEALMNKRDSLTHIAPPW